MANIMITEGCNLDCPYCFASEYVGDSAKRMDADTFQKALDFALSGVSGSVGIMGGEPTLHPLLSDFLRMAEGHPRAKRVTLMTNGVRVDAAARTLAESRKTTVLVNCNAPGDIGQVAFDAMRANIRRMKDEMGLRGRLTLGLNLYRTDQNFEHIFPLLSENGLRELRVSIVVPAHRCRTELDALSYFRAMKECVKRLFTRLFVLGVVPFFDCNAMPECVWDEDERDFFRAVTDASRSASSALARENHCHPVVDILPDLTAVRCFGLGDRTRRDIADYATVDELRGDYWRTVDCYSCNTCSSTECVACAKRLHGQCAGGCLAFKLDEIERVRAFADRICGEKTVQGDAVPLDPLPET